MVTKKHFIVLASEIANEESDEASEFLINFLCPILKGFNSKFNKDTFKGYINKKVIERENEI